MPEVIAFSALSRYVPIFSKTFSPFAPFPDDVVYITSTTSPFARSLPITPSPNNISGFPNSDSSRKYTFEFPSIFVISSAFRYLSVIVPEVTHNHEVVSDCAFVSINLCLWVVFLTKVSVKKQSFV